jgi:hypothetical protein
VCYVCSPLPESLAGLQQLSTLNLRYNSFEGPVSSIHVLLQSFLSAIILHYLPTRSFSLICTHSIFVSFVLQMQMQMQMQMHVQLPATLVNMTRLKVLDLRSNEGQGFSFPEGSLGAQRNMKGTWVAEAAKVFELFAPAQPVEVIATTTAPVPVSTSTLLGGTDKSAPLRSEISWLLNRVNPDTPDLLSDHRNADARADEPLPTLVMTPPDSPRGAPGSPKRSSPRRGQLHRRRQ